MTTSKSSGRSSGRGKTRPLGDVIAEAHATIRRARLNDPGEHFPYKHARVVELVEQDPPMGPGDPATGLDGEDDDRARASDFMSRDIADASRDYVQAQAAWLEDPSDTTRDAYQAARDALVEARRAHRRRRGASATIVAQRSA